MSKQRGDTAGDEAAGRVMPGRPKESGSRQQTHQDQASHSGSPKLDEVLTRRGRTPNASKPAAAK
jgi:hypothetical protein